MGENPEAVIRRVADARGNSARVFLEMSVQLRSVLNNPAANFDDLRDRDGKSDALGKAGSKQFIGEHPHMLRIVLKLNDVEVAVLSAHQV